MLAEQMLQAARADAGKISEDRRWLHAHAGTGFDIAETVQYVKETLTALGYTPKPCGKAGLVALAGGKKPGRVILLRADMDALPIEEQSGVDFASTNGCMHACGHDMHTAMLLEAARLLKAHEDEIHGTVKLMFQPAEEIFCGAKDMIGAGVLQDPPVDAAVMIHVTAGTPFTPGTVIVSAPGVSAPAADYFEIRVQGKGCHGSMPSAGIDPLNAAAHILIALQELQARELPMGEPAVLTIGTLHSGNAANAIPDSAVMGGTIRTFSEETRAMLKKRMEEIAAGVAGAFRATATVSYGSGCPVLKNDTALAGQVEGFTRELLGDNACYSAEQLMAASGGSRSAGGSEDFAYVSQEVPSLMLALAAGQPEKGYRWPQHHPMVTFDEEALAPGSAVYAYTALRWLEENPGKD